MSTRRTFLKESAVVLSVLALSKPSLSFASPCKCAGIVYTKENPGKWVKKVSSHIPIVTLEGEKVTVETKHGMSPAHFIVRHTLVLEDGTVVGAKTFSANDKPISTYALPAGYKGTVYATSFCNLHDLWLSEITI